MSFSGGVSTLTRTLQETVTFTWLKKDWLEMSQQYKTARLRIGGGMCSCFWCGHDFIDGEMMALAARVGHTNVVLCQECADMVLAAREINPEEANCE